MIGVGNALLTWVTGGSALSALSKVLLAVCALVLGVLGLRWQAVNAVERQHEQRFRVSADRCRAGCPIFERRML
jgi:hypothetical protein